jgi:2'-5' RNA ligase
MRLYAAIELDDHARAAIAAHQQLVRDAVDTGRDQTWIPPARMHLTLAFLGDVKEPYSSEVIRVIGSPLDAIPFTLGFGGVGAFPPRGAPRVIWIGTTGGSVEAAAVQRIVAERLRAVGVALENRRFHPHVTLARWRGARPADRARLRAIDDGAEVARVHVDHVTLFESRLSPSGPAYTPLARAALSGLPRPTVQ